LPKTYLYLFEPIPLNRGSLIPFADTTSNFTGSTGGLFIDKSIVSTQRGLIDQSGSHIRVGYLSGYASSPTKTGLVTVNSTVHRVYTSVNDVIINFRPEVDTLKPGDIVRVPRSTDATSTTACEYFLITKTTETSLDNGRVGNKISEKVSLGNFSWCGSMVGYDEFVEYEKSKQENGGGST
jgi:hypothetical protein